MSKNLKQQSFVSHLDELRGRLVWCVVVLIGFSFLFYSYVDHFLALIIEPVGHLVFTSPADAFVARVKLSIWGGLFLSFPFIVYHVWQFAKSALKDEEKLMVQWMAPFSILLFVLGSAFAYLVMIPISVKFLLSFASDQLVPMITVTNYISFLGTFVLGFGITFQMPLVLFFLIKIGIATPEFLVHYRAHAIVFILIVSAVMTPPDVVSQMLMAGPLILLYEISIMICRIAFRKKEYA